MYREKMDRAARETLKQSAIIGDAAGPNRSVFARLARELPTKVE
jgi:hypothetical protein